MKKQTSFVLAIVAIIAFCGCVSQELQSNPSDTKMLNQMELEHFFHTERSVEFLSSSGRVNVMYFPDGRQEIDWGTGNDKGNFKIKNDEFCSTWTKLRKGAESCSKIYKISDNEFEFIGNDGTSHAIMRLK